MDNDKKVIIDGVSVIEASNDLVKFNDRSNSEKNADQQRLKQKKRRIIIVSLVILAILVCILVAAIVLFSLWTTGVQLQEKKHRTIGNKEVDEELYQDKIDSLTTYHIQDNGLESWVILDYNRELEIMKVKNGESTTCYVSIRDPSKTQEMNQTEIDQTQTTTPGGAKAMQKNESLPVVILHPSTRPIVEKSMLGKRGQKLCQDVDTFWILSSCSSSGGGNVPVASRVRRATWLVYLCYWDWNQCGYITFQDSPGMIYYRCAWTCGTLTFVY